MAKYIKHVTGYFGNAGNTLYTVPSGRVSKIRGVMSGGLNILNSSGVVGYYNLQSGASLTISDAGPGGTNSYSSPSIYIGPGCYIANQSGTFAYSLVIIEEDLK